MNMFRGQQVPEVSAIDAESGRVGTTVLLDVRNADEWEAGHAPSAQWIPLGELEGARFTAPDEPAHRVRVPLGRTQRPGHGDLARVGLPTLEHGRRHEAWDAAGLSVVRDDGSPGEVI